MDILFAVEENHFLLSVLNELVSTILMELSFYIPVNNEKNMFPRSESRRLISDEFQIVKNKKIASKSKERVLKCIYTLNKSENATHIF